MEYTYTLIPAEGLSPEHVQGIDQNGIVYWIPIDLDNSDYQAYLRSLEV